MNPRRTFKEGFYWVMGGLVAYYVLELIAQFASGGILYICSKFFE